MEQETYATSENILVLGCGRRPKIGAINHDLHKHHDYVDIAHDLNVLPWPWEDCEFDKVYAISVLEHLHIDRLAIMNELWRIVKPDGIAILKMPHWNSDVTYQDMTHRWVVSLKTMDQLDPTTKRGRQYSFYTPYKWKILLAEFQNARETSVTFNLKKIVED